MRIEAKINESKQEKRFHLTFLLGFSFRFLVAFFHGFFQRKTCNKELKTQKSNSRKFK